MTPAKDAPAPETAAPLRLRDLAVGVLILCAVAAAYRPLRAAGLIWDDDGHITRPDLRSLHGLWRIWTEPGATQQYYPFLHTAFWAEHRVWGDSALCYHAANVGLHALSAWLLYLLLRRLSLAGAAFGALAWALHPVCAETVAWISEQKNTLSAALCLGAALAYLRFDRIRSRPAYAWALVLFLAALGSKTVTATLPAALLVIFWWRRGRLSWRSDVLPLAPFFVFAAGAGAVTAWVEKAYIGATGESFALSAADRVLVAGRALWFYLGKLAWPVDLSFIYPKWDVNSGAPLQYAYPAAAAIVLGVLFAMRRRSRGPLAAALLFCGMLFPALGFFSVYPFLYSYVADHFQYLASAAVLASAAAVLAGAALRLGPAGRVAAGAAGGLLLVGLGALTWLQSTVYIEPEVLWHTTLERNPGSWMAYQNLGGVFLSRGDAFQAAAKFRKALEIRPGDPEVLNELGVATMQLGRTDDAIALYLQALESAPERAQTHLNLGVALLQKREPEKAADQFQHAAELDPRSAAARKDLASAYLQEGNADDAVRELQKAAELEPDDAATLYGLGSALVRARRPLEALEQFRRSLELDEGQGAVHESYGYTLMQNHQRAEAVREFERACELDPAKAEWHFGLGGALANDGRPDEADAEYAKAPNIPEARVSLARDLTQKGRFAEAAGEMRAAAELRPDDAAIQDELATALTRTGASEEALAVYSRALELNPDFAPALADRGAAFFGLGRPEDAARDFEAALALPPSSRRGMNTSAMRNNLGIALARAGHPAQAVEQFRAALAENPNNSEARRNLSLLTEPAPAGAGKR
ncbi:MAG TPA: tetratricopeptide repeat protein [Opitutaceae bacterium]|jgi:Flp pilus assembly protein TadD